MKTIPASHLDLAEQAVATLATIGPDGRPQLSAVWFLFEDGKPRVSLNTTRQKTKNLLANPAVTLFVLDPNGYRYVEIRGTAQIEPDADYAFAEHVGAKYGGADLRQMDGPGATRVKVTIDPEHVVAADLTGAA
jgi:PPOX class probable F420-dependent enzyme